MDKINSDDIFKCKNCKKFMDEPYESECCGSLFCKYCKQDLSYSKCKECKKPFHFRKNLFAKNLMKKVQIKCEHNCGGKFTLEEMKKHSLNCENKLFKCNIDYCCSIDKKQEMIDHVLNWHMKEALILLENYEEFKPAMDKLLKNPNCRLEKKNLRNLE